ncbi:MAG: hypothetical protein CM1200mP36_05270 [Gammaproteobacteria bacterium]|nr:MAG: hypothetical protein CM1200mP36_05270 [Gammaproteobacteria bacterium]
MPEEVADRPGTFFSGDSQAFRLEHLKPRKLFSVRSTGAASLLQPFEVEPNLGPVDPAWDLAGRVRLVPVAVGSYRVESLAPERRF